MKLGHKANLLISIIIIGFELFLLGSVFVLQQEAEADAERMKQSRAIGFNINRLMRTVVALSLRIRSLDMAGDDDTTSLIRKLYLEMSDLEKSCDNDPQAKHAVIKVRKSVDDGMHEFFRAQKMVKSGEWEEAKDGMNKIKPLLRNMADRFEDIRRDQETIEASTEGHTTKQRRQTLNLLKAGAAINVFFVFISVSMFNRGITRRLRHLLRNTQRLSKGEALELPIPGNDELAQLDKTFSEVATALTTAINKQAAIFQHAMEVICTLNEEDRFAEVSTSASKVFGYRSDELVGMRLLDILVADQVDGVKEILLDLRKTNDAVVFESKVRKKDGPIITVQFTAQWSPEERILFLVAQDITERSYKQEVLEDAETRLRHIIETLPIGLIMTNLRGIVKLSNPVSETMLAASRAELLDKPISNFIHIPGESDVLVYLEKCLDRPLETPLVLPHRSKAYRDFLKLRDAKAERKAAAAQAAELARPETSRFDSETSALDSEASGYDENLDAEGFDEGEYDDDEYDDDTGFGHAPEVSMEVEFDYKQYIGGNLNIVEAELTDEHNAVSSAEGVDGDSITAEVSARMLDTNEGQRLLILIVDVSERAEVERMKQQFVAMVSHELKTPLMAVQVYLELLECGSYGTLNETGAEKLKAVENNVTRLTKLIKDLLDIERLESGTLSSRKRPCNLQEILDATRDSVMPSAEQSGINVTFPSVKISFNADPDRLVQVLVNLIANALKFSPEGSTVTVDAADEGDNVLISVTDEGRGIPRKFRKKIFERFQQVSVDDASRKGGAGLGLAICRSIVEQHSGEIAVESEEGKGSKFWMRLPKE
ncbi:MAG: ATP-binding protein [Candidatus Melainabacteria bacterium]|nr:ATP-binding protein [Candidatus Melainabacteria bacterium]